MLYYLHEYHVAAGCYMGMVWCRPRTLPFAGTSATPAASSALAPRSPERTDRSQSAVDGSSARDRVAGGCNAARAARVCVVYLASHERRTLPGAYATGAVKNVQLIAAKPVSTATTQQNPSAPLQHSKTRQHRYNAARQTRSDRRRNRRPAGYIDGESWHTRRTTSRAAQSSRRTKRATRFLRACNGTAYARAYALKHAVAHATSPLCDPSVRGESESAKDRPSRCPIVGAAVGQRLSTCASPRFISALRFASAFALICASICGRHASKRGARAHVRGARMSMRSRHLINAIERVDILRNGI